MKVLIQRVTRANVEIENLTIGKINKGYLIFVGFCKNDTYKNIDKAVNKIINLRLFHDQEGKVNLSIKDVNGQILVVSQFTLCAKIKSGTRPSFSDALAPAKARELYEYFVQELEKHIPIVRTGKFGAYMHVNLTNDGPFTIELEF